MGVDDKILSEYCRREVTIGDTVDLKVQIFDQ